MRAIVPAPRRQRTRHRATRPRDGRGIAKGAHELTHGRTDITLPKGGNVAAGACAGAAAGA